MRCYWNFLFIVIYSNYIYSMTLGANSRSIGIRNDVIERCENKWQCERITQYLSLGGRLTLINTIPDALSTYMMVVFPIPRGLE